jgi:hypothetical protein
MDFSASELVVGDCSVPGSGRYTATVREQNHFSDYGTLAQLNKALASCSGISE